MANQQQTTDQRDAELALLRAALAEILEQFHSYHWTGKTRDALKAGENALGLKRA